MSVSVIQSEGMLLADHPNYQFAFDLQKGTFSLSFLEDEKKRLVLVNATFAIFLAAEDGSYDPTPLLGSTDPAVYSISSPQENLAIETGTLDLFIIKDFSDRNFTAEFILTIDAAEDFPLFYLRVKNNDLSPVRVHSLCPLYINPSIDSTSRFLVCNNWRKVSFFKNGFQSWSKNEIMFWGDRDRSIPLHFGRQVESGNYDLIPEKGKENAFYSDYFSVIYDLETTRAMVAGFTTHLHHLTSISLILSDDPLQSPSFITASHADSIPVGEGQACTSEALFIITSKGRMGYLDKLVTYAKVTAERMSAITGTAADWTGIPTGYCTWYYYYGKVTEKDLLTNVDFFTRKKDEIPIDFIQLDDGYQTRIGDWTDLNSKFPSGMRPLVDQIHSAGFKAGLWTAPFLISQTSEIYFSHPNWLVQDKNGKLLTSGAINPAWGLFKKTYVLDPTRPEVQVHLEKLFQTITQEWGFDYVKIDFIYAACLPGSVYFDQSATRVDAYRQGLAAIRRGTGDNVFILGCGAPLGPSIGFCNGMRIGPDTNAQWEMLGKVNQLGRLWIPSLYPALHSTLLRSFMHQIWWINDPDCVIVRVDKSKLTPREVQTQLSLFGLSGGMILASDNMSKVPSERSEWFQKLLPPIGTAALPVDLMEKKTPELFFRYLDPHIPSAGMLVSATNFNKLAKDLVVDLKFFEMNPEATYHVYDFWGDQYLGRFQGDSPLPLASVPPHEHRYLLVKEFTPGDPQFISSNLHIGQGTLEVCDFAFNEDEKCVTFRMDLPGEHVGRLVFYLPEIYAIDDRKSPGILVADEPNEFGIWKVEIAFRNSREYSIQLKLAEAF